VQIEFLPASDGRLERSLAIALAPIIEERARRAGGTDQARRCRNTGAPAEDIHTGAGPNGGVPFA
jgi:hypothetical protein